jgi:hypothetical protein
MVKKRCYWFRKRKEIKGNRIGTKKTVTKHIPNGSRTYKLGNKATIKKKLAMNIH